MLKLPIEIMCLVGELLDESDLNSLARTHPYLFSALQPMLYRRNMLNDDRWVLIWAIINRQEQATKWALDTNVTTKLGEALAFAAQDGQEKVVEWLLSTVSADFSPKYNYYGQSVNWTSQHRIISKYTANSAQIVEKLKNRQHWDSHSSYRNLSPLAHAVVGGHVGVVRLLLKSGHCDQGMDDREGKTLLHYAAKEGSLDIVKMLFSTGTYDLNASDHRGDTVLSYAIRHGQTKIVEWLVNHADPISLDKGNMRDFDRTPLSLAVQYADNDSVSVLINSGKVNVNSRDIYGRTPLSYASQYAEASVLQLLIDSGAVDLDCRGGYGNTPLYHAAKRSDPSVMRVLLKAGAVDLGKEPTGRGILILESRYSERADCGRNILSFAVQYSDVSIVQFLIDAPGVKLDSRDMDERSPVSYAAQYSGVSVLRLFNDCPAVDINSKDRFGRTPFSYAVMNSEAAVAKLLIDSGRVDLDSRDNRGRTPLSYAAEESNELIMKLLIDSGEIELDSKDDTGRTPLSYAAEKSSASVVKLLIDSGEIDLDHRDSEGFSPLFFAMGRSDAAIAKLLIDSGEVELHARAKAGGTPLSYAIQHSNLPVVRLLLESGKINLNSRYENVSERFEQLLSGAMASANTSIVQLLIDSSTVDFKLNPHDETSKRLLLTAAKFSDTSVIKLLIDSGATYLDGADEDGCTPIWYATARRERSIVRLLIDAGASLNTAAHDGQTPISLATQLLDYPMVKLLVESGALVYGEINVDGWTRTMLSFASHCPDSRITKLLINAAENQVDDPECFNQICQLELDSEYPTRHSEPDNLVTKVFQDYITVSMHSKEHKQDQSGYGKKLRNEICRQFIDISPGFSDEDIKGSYFSAIRRSEVPIVRGFIDSNIIDLETMGPDRRSALSIAAEEADSTIVKLLIDSGRVNLDSRDENGRSPLSYAAQYSSVSTVKLLLDSQKVEVDAAYNFVRTPLSYAVEHPHLRNLTTWILIWHQYGRQRQLDPRESPLESSTLKALIDTGQVDLDSCDEQSRTPLSYAAEFADSTAVDFLIRSGAKQLELRDQKGQTPIHHAIKKCNVLVVKSLLDEHDCDPNSPDNNGEAPIFKLLDLCGHLETMKHWRARGLDDDILKTTESSACRLVMLLLGCNRFDPNCLSQRGETPLGQCFTEDYCSEVRRILISSPRVGCSSSDDRWRRPRSYGYEDGEYVEYEVSSDSDSDSDEEEEHSDDGKEEQISAEDQDESSDSNQD